MPISLSPKTEALLSKRAEQDGSDINTVADQLLSDVLLADELEVEATRESVRRALEDVEAGRIKPFKQYAAELRTMYNLPVHLSDAELLLEK
jgi:hypothetical protein